MDAKERVVLHNLRLVISRAKRARRIMDLPANEMEELLQDGIFGLMRATEKFDLEHESKAKFSTYAIHWIDQAIYRGNGSIERTIRIPAHIQSKLRQEKAAYRELRISLGRAPTDAQVADYMGMSTEDLQKLRFSTLEALSLDDFIDKDEDGEWVARVSTLVEKDDQVVDGAFLREQRKHLQDTLEHLSYRERKVLELRYGLDGKHPRTLDEVGRTFNVTRERIRQLETQSLKKLQALASMRGPLTTSAISSEDVALQLRRARDSVDYLTLSDYLAKQARERTMPPQDAVAMEARGDQSRIVTDSQYEKNMRARAFLASAPEAGGRLQTRQDFFKQYETTAPYLPPYDLRSPSYTYFLQAYGTYTTAVFSVLHRGLQALARDGETVSLATLEEHISQYDDSMFGVRPEFTKAVLEAGEQQGFVFCDRSGYQTLYRLRQPGDQESDSELNKEALSDLPEGPAELLATIRGLGAGKGSDTAITFAQLRRHWAESRNDPNENRLRWLTEYLRRAGSIAISATRLRGHDIWLTNSQKTRLPKLKPHELWYGDRE